VIIAASIEEGLRKGVDARVVLLVAGKTRVRSIVIAALLIAALIFAVSRTVFLDAVLVAVAAGIAAGARSSAQVRSIRLGSSDDGRGHVINSLLDGDLLVELLEVILSGLVHEDALGSLKRNFKGRDSVSDLDGVGLLANGGLVVLGDIHGSKLLVTILAGLTVTLDVGLDVLKLILEGVTGLAVDLSIVDPEEGVDISDVGTDGRIVVVCEAAGTNRSGSGHINVGWENKLVEDRAREAGLDVEDEVLEELPGSHGVKKTLHLVSIKIAATREAHGTLRTVIIEENKDVIIGTRLEALATASASHILTRKDVEESSAVNKGTSIILRNSGIHIRASGLVDDLTGLGVRGVVSDIILHHNDDVIIRDTHLVDDLISMANISLVTIVVVTIRTSSKNNPSVLLTLLLGEVRERVGTNSNSKGKNSKKICVHFFLKLKKRQ